MNEPTNYESWAIYHGSDEKGNSRFAVLVGWGEPRPGLVQEDVPNAFSKRAVAFVAAEASRLDHVIAAFADDANGYDFYLLYNETARAFDAGYNAALDALERFES